MASSATGTSAGEPDGLLPGEPPDSGLPDDAAHWAAVYGELVELLAQSRMKSSELLARHRRRLDFWRARLRRP